MLAINLVINTYSGDYDEDRYDNDESYRDGVDDMLDELGE